MEMQGINTYKLKINLAEENNLQNHGNKLNLNNQDQTQEQTPSTFRKRDNQNFLIPRTSIQMINQSTKRFSKIYAGISQLTIANVFDNAFKQNVIQYLSSKDKKQSDIRFLKKHLQACEFFQNYAIPLGDDVFEQCLLNLQVKTLQPNTCLIQKGKHIACDLLNFLLKFRKKTLQPQNIYHLQLIKQLNILKGEQVDNLYILLFGSAIKTKQKMQKSENLILQGDQDLLIPSNHNFSSANLCSLQLNHSQSLISPKTSFTNNLNSCTQTPSNQFINKSSQQDMKIEPITSLFEQQFIQRSDSVHYVYNIEECVYAYLSSQDFSSIIKNSKNSELIYHLNEIRKSQFLSDWPVIKLKYIINQSQLKSFQRNQYVYKQGDQSTQWYVILNGEFEYEKEIVIDNEINDMQKACFDKLSHEFKKQSILTDESQKGKGFLRVSLLQQGELFGLEDLIPKEVRRYNLKCISNIGTVRQINEQLFYKLLSKNTEEGQKLQNLATQKMTWLQKATEEKMPINQKIFNTILDSKRNRTIQLIKKQEEIREREIQNMAKMVIKAEINTHSDQRSFSKNSFIKSPSKQFQNLHNQDGQRDVLGLAEKLEDRKILNNFFSRPILSHNQSSLGQLINQVQSPIRLVQPENKITFTKPPVDEEGIKNRMQKEISQERKQMKEAKEDLLSQYRVSIDKYFSESNKKLYKKIEIKKLGASYYIKPRQQSCEDNSHLKHSQKINEKESLSPIRSQIKKHIFNLQDSINQHNKDYNFRFTSREASKILSELHSQPANQMQISLKSSLPNLENSIQLNKTIKPQIIPSLKLSKIGMNSQSPIIIKTARNFSQSYNKLQNQNYSNDNCQSEQNSPLLSFQNKLFIPQQSKKIILKQNQSNTPNSTILEKYNMSTQSSFFKKGNEVLEQIITARSQQITSKQALRSNSQQKFNDTNHEGFQLNKLQHKQTIENEFQIIKNFKQKINSAHKRSSSLIN